MFLTPAFAQEAGGAAPGGMEGLGGLGGLIPIILIFVIFYFLLIRPQQKKMKEHRQMTENLKRGDHVVTGGGLVGTVTKVLNEREIQVEIADGVKVRVVKQTVSENLSKHGAAAANPAPASSNDEEEAEEEEVSKRSTGSRGRSRSRARRKQNQG